MLQNGILTLYRWLFKTIDIITQQTGINAYGTGKLGNIYFFVSQKESLQNSRFSILIFNISNTLQFWVIIWMYL